MTTDYQPHGFGETLRRRREQMGLSLNDVAVRTRVRKAYLQALEEENLPALPGSAYAIGFLRIYARHLDLAVEPLAAALTGKAEPGSERRSPSGAEGGGIVQRGRTRGGKAWRLLLLVVVLVLVGAGYLFYLQSRPGAPVPVKPETPPVVTPALPAAAPVAAVPQPSAQAPAPASAPAPAVEVVPLPVLPPEGAIVRIVAAAAGVMKVTLDGQDSRDYELQPEQKLNWKVGSQLQLELSAPTLVRCWVNDQEVALAEHVAVRLVGAATKPAPRQ